MVAAFRFTKGQGTGNDFILYRDDEGPLSSERIAFLCDRRRGIGADGVIRAVRSADIDEGAASLAEDEAAEWFLDYYNADGSPAEMCGNGIRVYVAYLLRNGLIQLGEGDTVAIGTRAGVRDVQRSGKGFQTDLGGWRHDEHDMMVRVGGIDGERAAFGVHLGNPHVVVELADARDLRKLDLSRPPAITPAPPNGANVEFVVRETPYVDDGVGRICMRVHERGSGETLSCGTGAAAAALVARRGLGAGAPHNWRVDVPGGRLGVRMFPTEDGEHVGLSGPAELVFRGEVLLP